jgi:hypothetical protein
MATFAFDRFSGNFASSIPEQDQKATLIAAIPRTVGFRSPTTPQCPVPSRPAYRGGITSGTLLANQIRQTQACAYQQALAVQKLSMVPGCPVDPATRFIQYQRLPNPAPCPVSTINPAIPAAINGPCTNVIGICTTWPPS